MIEILRVLIGTHASLARDRQILLIENLLLRHQLAVARHLWFGVYPEPLNADTTTEWC